MARYEVRVEGDALGRAAAALNEAGVPILATWGEDAESERARRPSCLRGATLPILLVIVLAFVAQRLISPAADEERSYDELIALIKEHPESVESVTLDPGDVEMTVTTEDGDEHRSGYPPSAEERLVEELRRRGIETEIESEGGSSVVSIIVYLLPFLLFFAFWLFLSSRMRRGEGPGRETLTGLRAVVEAPSAQSAEDQVRGILTPVGEYELSA